jgi:hypothetical protein
MSAVGGKADVDGPAGLGPNIEMTIAKVRRYPSIIALATAWSLTLACEVGWTIGLYNFDGEMGVTPPPPMWSITVWATLVATLVVMFSWLVRRVSRRFWLILFGAFAAKGCLAAGLTLASVFYYGAAPFTVGGSYLEAASSILTALVSGTVVAVATRAIDGNSPNNPQGLEQHFS